MVTVIAKGYVSVASIYPERIRDREKKPICPVKY